MKRHLFFALFLPFVAFSQAPAGYYEGTTGLTGYALKTKLKQIISAKNFNWHYGDLPAFYNQTDLDRYYDHDATNSTVLLDVYSEKPTETDAYEYTSANLISSAGAEGLGYNREHVMPQSTFYSNYPMYSDLFFVIPTDARINQLRSNYPYGFVKSTTPFYTFTNGSKINSNGTANSAYTGRVYEPINEFKGDIARSLLYFAVRYEGKLNTFKYYNGTSPANDTNPLDGTEEKAFEDWYIALLLQWHNQDPVSQREIDRNNAVYNIQKNRNPFIDHPEWVSTIWNQTADAVVPQSPQSLTATTTGAYFVSLSWAPSAESDLLGYRIYQNGTLIANSKTSAITIDHLQPSSAYNFTVRAYDSGYMESADSNPVSVTTLGADSFAKDLIITKYLEGSGQNKAIEITNKTGHPVDLNKYRLSIQFYNSDSGSYYFPAPYELEGTVQNNETFVVLNPYSQFSCITTDQAKFVTAAPQMAFSGSQYLELRYASSTVDAIGTKSVNNSATLQNVSLYRLNSINQPNSTFTLSEWQTYPEDYCGNIGLAASSVEAPKTAEFSVYPNPVLGNTLYLKGKNPEKIALAKIFDMSGRSVKQVSAPFKNTNGLDVSSVKPGVYILKIDSQSIKFVKK